MVTQINSANFSIAQNIFKDKASAKKQLSDDYVAAKKLLPHPICKEESNKTDTSYVVASDYADYIYGEIKIFNI